MSEQPSDRSQHLIPASLRDWTYEAIEALCAAGLGESDRHDFKLGLMDSYNVTKTCCAFANTYGGFIVLGVKDQDRKRFEIVGLSPDKELYGELLAKVRAEPEIPIPPPQTLIIPGTDKRLYVFEIRQSNQRPHLPTAASDRIFWKRQGSSCVQMALEEIRYQMNSYQEKREKLMLLLLDLRYKVQSLDEENRMPDGLYSAELFSFEIIDRVMVEAFSFLKADPDIFNKLTTFKRRLAQLNGEKQKLLSALAISDGSSATHANNARRIYRGQVPSLFHHLSGLAQQIEQSVAEVSGVKISLSESAGEALP